MLWRVQLTSIIWLHSMVIGSSQKRTEEQSVSYLKVNISDSKIRLPTTSPIAKRESPEGCTTTENHFFDSSSTKKTSPRHQHPANSTDTDDKQS